MLTRRAGWRGAITGFAVSTGLACSDQVEPVVTLPPSGPVERAELVGEYVAIVFNSVLAGETTDLLVQGASFDLTLEGSAQYSGRVMAPGLGDGGADVEDMLGGAWTYDIVTRRLLFPGAGSTFLSRAFIPERSEDLETLYLSTSIPGGMNEPTTVVVLERQ